jgi:hypothetical protein
MLEGTRTTIRMLDVERSTDEDGAGVDKNPFV